MTEHDDDACPDDDNLVEMANLAEEITRHLQSGEPVRADDLIGENPASAGPIRQLLPTLRTMVALGEQAARGEGSKQRLGKRDRRRP